MFSLGGMGEILVILILALIFVGPEKLPEVATKLGRIIREFRRVTNDLKSQLVEHSEIAKPLQDIQSALYEDVIRPVRNTAAGFGGAYAGRRPAPVARPALPAPRAVAVPSSVTDDLSSMPTLKTRAKATPPTSAPAQSGGET